MKEKTISQIYIFIDCQQTFRRTYGITSRRYWFIFVPFIHMSQYDTEVFTLPFVIISIYLYLCAIAKVHVKYKKYLTIFSIPPDFN